MSVLEDLLRKGMDQLDDKILTGDRFDDLTSKLKDELEALDDGPIKDIGEASLQELISRKSEVLHLKKSGLVLFMTHLAGGKDHEAQMEFIRGTADADDLIAGMWDDARTVAQQKRSEEEWKAAALEIVKAIGQAGAQVLLPMLLSVL